MDRISLSLSAQDILNDPLFNKGTAFTKEEREEFGLFGFLPSCFSTIEEQVRRGYLNFSSKPTDLSKYIFLSTLQNRNEILFHRLVYEHVEEMLPLIYTPTVGDASLHFSTVYNQHRGVYFSYPHIDHFEDIVKNLPNKEIDVIVATDGERVLGLGDLGSGGMAISIGKLSLYTLFGGIHPSRVLPVMIDVGTNNEELLEDSLYLGWRHTRLEGEKYEQCIDAFVKAIKKHYPRVLLQWEDFGKNNARHLLEKYRDQICSFNDDIQGTASVLLAALLSALKTLDQPLKKQRIVVFGGGSAGMGICEHLLQAFTASGISEEEALTHFYVVDRSGLLHDEMETLSPIQEKFAQSKKKIDKWEIPTPKMISLYDVVKNAHPTVLIGVSAQGGAFTEEIVKEMLNYTPRPIIFPLSNPTDRSEAHPKDLMTWTDGQAIIATGSPFPPVAFDGKNHIIAQCNNVYIFPGVGLGIVASKAKFVSDTMFLRAAEVLSEFSPQIKDRSNALFPLIGELREVSKEIAVAVGLQAQKEGHAKKSSEESLRAAVEKAMWFPSYPVYTKTQPSKTRKKES